MRKVAGCALLLLAACGSDDNFSTNTVKVSAPSAGTVNESMPVATPLPANQPDPEVERPGPGANTVNQSPLPPRVTPHEVRPAG